MMTNWRTISNSIKRLRDLDEKLGGETEGLTKKEVLNLTRERDKLERALGGIKEMGGLPDILFVIDTNKEDIAVAEANKLGIPVIGVIDSNSDPKGINFPVPGNDDALRAINLYCDLVAGAVFSGLQSEVTASGGDLGEAVEAPVEDLPPKPEATSETAKLEAKATPAEETSVTEEALAADAEAKATQAEETPVTEEALAADADVENK
jgi:small subunit ribosomal protein S2